MENKKAPIPKNPELLDLFFGQLQEGLVNNLGWLDRAFGKAERLVKYNQSKRKIYTPNVYNGRNEYIDISPDSNIGNFSFFVVEDPQEVTQQRSQYFSIKADFALIVWFDYRKVNNSFNIRNKEQIKREILDLLNGGITLKKGSFSVDRVFELSENIFKEFTLDEIDNQFLMHPYGGFRFEGTLNIEENCPL